MEVYYLIKKHTILTIRFLDEHSNLLAAASVHHILTDLFSSKVTSDILF